MKLRRLCIPVETRNCISKMWNCMYIFHVFTNNIWQPEMTPYRYAVSGPPSALSRRLEPKVTLFWHIPFMTRLLALVVLSWTALSTCSSQSCLISSIIRSASSITCKQQKSKRCMEYFLHSVDLFSETVYPDLRTHLYKPHVVATVSQIQ